MTEIKDEVVDDEKKNFVVALTAGGTIKKVNPRNYASSQKVLGDNSTITDVHTKIMHLSSKDTVLIITNKGNCVKTTVANIPECKWRDKGNSLLSVDKTASSNEKIVSFFLPTANTNVLVYTRDGLVKRSKIEDMITIKSYYQVCKLGDNDEVIGAEIERAGSILMLTKNGMSLNFEKSDIPVQGRISGGVRGINMDDGDKVIFAGQNDATQVVLLTNNGYVKRINTKEFPLAQRYRKGVKYINFANGGKEVIFACAGDGNIVLAVDFGLKLLPLETKKIPLSDRLATGNQIIKKQFISISQYLV